MRPQILVGTVACLLSVSASVSAQEHNGELGIITAKAAIVRVEGTKKADIRTRLEVGSFVLVDAHEKGWVHIAFRVYRDGDPVWMDGWTKLKNLNARSRHGFSFERPAGDTSPVYTTDKTPPPAIETDPPDTGFTKDGPSRTEWEEELGQQVEGENDEWSLDDTTSSGEDSDDLGLGIEELDSKKTKKKKKK